MPSCLPLPRGPQLRVPCRQPGPTTLPLCSSPLLSSQFPSRHSSEIIVMMSDKAVSGIMLINLNRQLIKKKLPTTTEPRPVIQYRVISLASREQSSCILQPRVSSVPGSALRNGLLPQKKTSARFLSWLGPVESLWRVLGLVGGTDLGVNGRPQQQRAAFAPAARGALMPIACPRWTLARGVRPRVTFGGKRLGRGGEERGSDTCWRCGCWGAACCHACCPPGKGKRPGAGSLPLRHPQGGAGSLPGAGRCGAGPASLLGKKGSASFWLY